MRVARALTTAVAGFLAAGALAGPASAAAPCAPASGITDFTYQTGLTPLLPAGEAAARRVAGAQFTMLWLDPARRGWDVGIAPGPLDVAAARAAIVGALQAALPATDAAYLADRLHVEPEPYSEADLNATRDAIVAGVASAPRSFGFGVGWGLCTLSDGVRVEVTLFNDSTPADADAVRALLAPYGDKVRLAISDTAPPAPATGVGVSPGVPAPYAPPAAAKPKAPVAFARYVALPTARRCVRGTVVHVALPRATRRDVRSATVTVAGHRRTLTGGRMAIVLKGRRTTIRVAVALRDGRTAQRSVTLIRCVAG
jgi:hypothetical protein